MRTEIATTYDQSKRLMDCGVPADTADMFYQTPITASQKATREDILLVRKADKTLFDTDIPAWSLSALLELLPSYLEDFPFTKWIKPFGDGEICEKDHESTLSGYVRLYRSETHWIVDYDWDGFMGTLPQSENPIEACVRAIELLYANGYKFNEL